MEKSIEAFAGITIELAFIERLPTLILDVLILTFEPTFIAVDTFDVAGSLAASKVPVVILLALV